MAWLWQALGLLLHTEHETVQVVCLGKNYLKHAQELGDAVPEKPVYALAGTPVRRHWLY